MQPSSDRLPSHTVLMQRLNLPPCSDNAKDYNQLTVSEYFDMLALIDKHETQRLLDIAARLARIPMLEVIESEERPEEAA